MKKHTINLLLCAFATTILMFSCRKEDRSLTKKPSTSQPHFRLGDDGEFSDEDGDLITTNIEAYYELMDNHRNDDEIDGSISIDSFDFVTEGAYNYYAVTSHLEQGDCKIEGGRFIIEAPINEQDGTIGLGAAAVAFWEIKEELMSAYDEVEYEAKELCHFDLQTRAIGEVVEITVSYGFVAGVRVSWGTPYTFPEAANHAWKTWQPASWPGVPPAYEPGQCDINMTTKSVISNTVDNNVWGAAYSLRKYGLNNYYNNSAATPVGYYVNIGSTAEPGFGNNGGSNSPYTTMGIPGYDNTNTSHNGATVNCWVWSTWIMLASHQGPISDPDIVYKDWLITV